MNWFLPIAQAAANVQTCCSAFAQRPEKLA